MSPRLPMRLAAAKCCLSPLLGTELLLLRDNSGAVSALKDFCPHRGIPLRHGNFDGCQVECCYHGWRFGMDGVCSSIPSLLPDDQTDIRKIKTGKLPCEKKMA
jgi:phenylpropionate dioxygenase-like ring-hydroxylating dioxygenase large terminal subunit